METNAMPKKISIPNAEEFVQLYIEHNNDELMEMLGLTRSQLRYRVERLGLNKNPNIVRKCKVKSYKGPDHETLRKLAKNHNAIEIAEMYGAAPVTVRTWFKEAGIVKRGRFKPDHALFSTHTPSEIAKMYDVSVSSVSRYRKKHNLPLVERRGKLPESAVFNQLLKAHSILEIAQMYDVSTVAVENRIKKELKKTDQAE